MTSFLLLNSGDFVLLNSGDKVLLNVSPDTTPPTVSIISPLNGETVGTSFTVSGTAADDTEVSLVEVKIDSEAYQTATGTTSWSINLSDIAEGIHTITARATDSSSNQDTDIISINVDPALDPSGSGSGGKVKKSVGHQLTDLGPRPHIIQQGESISKIVLRPINTSKAKLVISQNSESICTIIPHFGGYSTSKLVIPVKSESISQLYYKSAGESWAIPHPSVLMERIEKKTDNINKAIKALSYLNMLDSIK